MEFLNFHKPKLLFRCYSKQLEAWNLKTKNKFSNTKKTIEMEINVSRSEGGAIDRYKETSKSPEFSNSMLKILNFVRIFFFSRLV